MPRWQTTMGIARTAKSPQLQIEEQNIEQVKKYNLSHGEKGMHEY